MAWRARPLAEGSDGLYVEVAKSVAKRNFLVIGPAGSGKLSLVRGLAALTYPRTRKFLFDWEVEPEAQNKLLVDLERRAQRLGPILQVWIHRHIDHIPTDRLQAMLVVLQSRAVSQGDAAVCCATASSLPTEQSTRGLIDTVFGVRISVTGSARDSGSVEAFLRLALVSFSRHYHKQFTSIESEAVEYLEEQAFTSGLPTALSLLEKAIVLEESSRLRMVTLSGRLGRDHFVCRTTIRRRPLAAQAMSDSATQYRRPA